jgi:hypothetical protein
MGWQPPKLFTTKQKWCVVRMRVFLKFKRNPCILNDANFLHLEMGLYFQILVPIHKKLGHVKIYLMSKVNIIESWKKERWKWTFVICDPLSNKILLTNFPSWKMNTKKYVVPFSNWNGGGKNGVNPCLSVWEGPILSKQSKPSWTFTTKWTEINKL